MEIGKIIYVTNKKKWHKWLAKNYNKEKEVWLIYYRKSSGKKRIPYNDAVEEALRYGWIDSIVKNIDKERFAQRFTPRRSASRLSEMNKERVRRLIKKNKMTPFGLRAISHVFDKNKKDKFTIAPDILKVLMRNKSVWKNFQKFSDGYKRVRIGYIESQRKHGDRMFKKSLQNFVIKTAKNKKFGMLK